MNTTSQTIAVDQVQLGARAAVYRLLGRLWLHELDPDLLGELRSSPLSEAFLAAGGVLPPQDAERHTLETLAGDYCQLFLGPSGHLPPYQSVWTEGHFQGAATVAAQSQRQTLNLPPTEGMADHLGEQLTAMASIIERLAVANAASVSQLDAAGHFFSHRLDWTDSLCQCAAERAETAFYRSVAAMTQAFLTEEREAWSALEPRT